MASCLYGLFCRLIMPPLYNNYSMLFLVILCLPILVLAVCVLVYGMVLQLGGSSSSKDVIPQEVDRGVSLSDSLDIKSKLLSSQLFSNTASLIFNTTS